MVLVPRIWLLWRMAQDSSSRSIKECWCNQARLWILKITCSSSNQIRKNIVSITVMFNNGVNLVTSQFLRAWHRWHRNSTIHLKCNLNKEISQPEKVVARLPLPSPWLSTTKLWRRLHRIQTSKRGRELSQCSAEAAPTWKLLRGPNPTRLTKSQSFHPRKHYYKQLISRNHRNR